GGAHCGPPGCGLCERRRRHGARRRGVSRIARERIGERAVALRKARDVGRTSCQENEAESGQSETRKRASLYPRNAITHRLPPTPTRHHTNTVCADRVKGRFKMNRRLTIMSKFAREYAARAPAPARA